ILSAKQYSMGLIASYNLRSMIVRKGTAAMTAGGIAMVVAVFVMTLAIAQGFRQTLVVSGSPQNAIVLRKSATAETVSAVLRSDVDLMMPAFQRDGYQSMTVKLADPSMFESFNATVTGDPRLYLEAQREQDYYAEQSRALTTVIRVFGTFVTLILAIGAVFGA